MILRHPILAATLSLIVCNAVVSLPVAQYSRLFQNFVERIQPPFDNGLQSLVELVELASDTEEVQSICHLGKAVQKTHDFLSTSVSITSAINSRYNEEIVSMTAKVGEHERNIQALRQQLEDLKQRSTYLHEKVSSYRSMAAEYASVLNTVKEELQRKRKERTVTETVMLAISWLPSTIFTTPLLLSEIDKLEIQMNELESTPLRNSTTTARFVDRSSKLLAGGQCVVARAFLNTLGHLLPTVSQSLTQFLDA